MILLNYTLSLILGACETFLTEETWSKMKPEIKMGKSWMIICTIMCILIMSCTQKEKPLDVAEVDHERIISAADLYLLEDEEQLAFCRDLYRDTLLPGQMAEDGSFPRELGRTKPYGYSLLNLEAMTMVVQILSTPEENLWEFSLEDGRSIGKGIAFMYPYMEDKSTWFKEPDIMYYDQWPVRHPFLLFGGLALDVPEYIDLWLTLDPDPTVEEVIRNFPIRQPVLWID